MGTLQDYVYLSTIVFCCGSTLFLGRACLRGEGFHQKGKLIEEATKEVSGHENCQDQEGSPCGFSSQVAEPPVRAATIISHSVPSPLHSHFTLLYYTMVRDGALPLGYLQEFISLEAPARRSANRLQASAVAVSDSAASMTLVALRRESEHRASQLKNQLRISSLSLQT